MAEALQSDSDFSDSDQTPLERQFNEAANHVRKITGKLNNEQLLDLYGLFKQGTEGNCNTPKPGWLDGRGRRKWEAWKSKQDMSLDKAKENYIALVQKLDPELSLEIDTGNKESWTAVSSLRRPSEPDIDVNEMTVLEAAKENCGDRLRELIKSDPSLKDERDEDGLTVLHWAADRNAVDALTAGISGGCDIAAVDESGQTALHYAVSCGHVNATQILLQAGASPTVKDLEGNTAIDLASDDDIKNLLLDSIK